MGEFQMTHWSGVLRRRWPVVLASIALFAAIASLGVLRAYPTYRSSGSVALPTPLSADGTTQAPRLDDELALANSSLVRGRVADRAGSGVKLTAAAGSKNGVLTLTADAPTAKAAAAAAAAFVSAYVDFKTQAARRQFDVAVSSLQRALASTDAPGAVGNAQQDAVAAQRRAYSAALQDLLVRRELAASSEPEVVAAPAVPSRALQPPMLPAAVIGILAGLVVGLAVAAAVDARDDRVRDEDELAVIAADVALALRAEPPAVVSIPEAARPRRAFARALGRRRAPLAPATSSDWYMLARAAVDAQAAKRQHMVVQVTSTDARDCCVPAALGLAATFARTGRNTLLVAPDPLDEAELRRGLASKLGTYGLADLYQKTASVDDVIQPVDTIPGLCVVLSGSQPGLLDVLAGAQARTLFDDLRRAAEVIVVVTPALLSRPIPRAVLPFTDEVVIVAGVRTSSLTGVRKALELVISCVGAVNALLVVGTDDLGRHVGVRTVATERPISQVAPAVAPRGVARAAAAGRRRGGGSRAAAAR